jgi:hypothetical protein
MIFLTNYNAPAIPPELSLVERSGAAIVGQGLALH